MKKGLAAQIIMLILVIGFVDFAGGFMVAGGVQRLTGLYTIGENITVRVKLPDATDYTNLNIYSGMTMLDVTALSTDTTTKLYVFDGVPSASVRLGSESYANNRIIRAKINGEYPSVGFAWVQLKDGDNIEIEWYT